MKDEEQIQNQQNHVGMGLLSLSLLMALALTAPELRAQDTLVVNLSLRTTDFSFGNQDAYDIIIPKHDKMSHISIPGHPQLPTWNPCYIIPYWKDIAYCEILALDSVQIPGTYNIYPAQKEVPIGDSADWTPPDPAIYNSDSLYPGKSILEPGSGAFDGARIATLNLYPIQYRPKSGKLFLYTSAKIKLVFKDAEPPINAKQRYAHVQEIYDRMMADLVENDADIGAWYRRPAIIDPNEGKYTPPPAYIIITTEDQSQDASLLAYKDWMYQRGYPTLIVTVQQALQGQAGVDDAERLRNYIIQQYNNGVSFFLFLGHEDGIPWRYLCAGDDPPPGSENIIPSDLYFSSLNGDWNGDGDGFFGEPMHDDGSFDFTPEVFVGRVLAKTTLGQGGEPIDEVANWVSKVLSYEKNPGNANGVTHVFSSCTQGMGWKALEAYSHYPQPPFTFSMLEGQTAAQNRDYMNNHLMGWVNIYAHGEPAHWAPYDANNYLFFGPRYLPFGPTEVNLYQLTNQNAYPIVYSISCRNAAFDDMVGPYPTDTTVCEGWVEAYSDRGAVAFLGNTRNGFLGANSDLHHAFLDILFAAGSNYLLGTAEAWSRASDFGGTNYIRYVHNLFGSPLTEVWTNVPVLTTTSASPTSIQRLVPTTITVTVKYDNGLFWAPLSGARVTLYGCGVYKIGTTGPNGTKTFYNVVAEETGVIKATATKHDYKPSWANITVTGKGDMAISDDDGNLPLEFFMALASGNPVKGLLKLQFGIPFEDQGPVSLKIYDVSGRSVQTVFSEEKPAGYYDLSIPTSSFSAGTYFLRLETKNKAKTEKVIMR